MVLLNDSLVVLEPNAEKTELCELKLSAGCCKKDWLLLVETLFFVLSLFRLLSFLGNTEPEILKPGMSGRGSAEESERPPPDC